MQSRSACGMLTLSPSDSACRWVFYILSKEILPVLLWRGLHLVKSHYYGNVRVLEIMARWERLDCLWHNSPISISSCFPHTLSTLGCFHMHTQLYLSRLITKVFFHTRPTCRDAFSSFKSNTTRVAADILTDLERLPLICYHVSAVLWEMICHPSAISCRWPSCCSWHDVCALGEGPDCSCRWQLTE